MIGEDSNVLFVDDGSSDRTWPTIEALHRRSRGILGLKLSHNRGHQNALLAGVLSATGNIVVSIDADFQDDPELMTEMAQAYAAGADVVLTVRRTRTTDNAFKRITAEPYLSLPSLDEHRNHL
jgi:glycosyltransferase involved in cell wall biosynthesis